MEPIRILIADDHTLVREGIRRMLEEEEDFEIVAEASNGEEVLKKVRTSKPNVILMDVAMPVIDGFEATRRLVKQAKSHSKSNYTPTLPTRRSRVVPDAMHWYYQGVPDQRTGGKQGTGQYQQDSQ